MNIISRDISALVATAVFGFEAEVKGDHETVKTVLGLSPASADFSLGLLLDREDGGDMFLRNVGLFPNYMSLYPPKHRALHRRLHESLTPNKRFIRSPVTSAKSHCVYALPCAISCRLVPGVPEADPDVWATVQSLGGAHCTDQPH
jgi:hypothetical protein